MADEGGAEAFLNNFEPIDASTVEDTVSLFKRGHHPQSQHCAETAHSAMEVFGPVFVRQVQNVDPVIPLEKFARLASQSGVQRFGGENVRGLFALGLGLQHGVIDVLVLVLGFVIVIDVVEVEGLARVGKYRHDKSPRAGPASTGPGGSKENGVAKVLIRPG
ncbi:hypothetical protein [Devosia sp.]|uniref:hypothetical protein n=1 Tax=Devosia sp. TaxID=1871048 RepID=UPI0025D314D9|nr:hypothetical protein [Devosia sp.]MCR6634246.1 hypothetical protein [Devosia sp.]